MTGNELIDALAPHLPDPERSRKQLAWLNGWILGEHEPEARDTADVMRFLIDQLDRAIAIKDLEAQGLPGIKDLQNANEFAPGEPGT